MRIKNKLSILLVSLAVIFTVTFVMEENVEKTKFIYIMKDGARNGNKLLNRIMDLKSRSQLNMVSDYTYWDDLVDFVGSGDKGWAALNLDTALDTFGADMLWVYRPDMTLVYSSGSSRAGWAQDIPMTADVFRKLFIRQQIRSFFLNSPNGVVNIYGGPIHFSSDNGKAAPAQGYLFAGKLMDNKHIADLELLVGGRIRITPITSWQKLSPAGETRFEDGRIHLNRVLLGPNHEPVANLETFLESELAKDYAGLSKRNILVFMSFILLSFILFAFVLVYWVNIPLGMISKALDLEKASYVDKIKNKKDEFGVVAKLITRFFNQKAVLLKEIVSRKQIEESLLESTRKYEALIGVVPLAVYTMDASGFVTSWSPAAERMFGWKAKEIIGKPSLVIPRDRAEDITMLRGKVLEGKFVEGFETRVSRKDGAMILSRIYAGPLKDEHDKITGIMVAVKNLKDA